MNLKIKYFGLISEITNHKEESIVFGGGTVTELLQELYKKYPELVGKDFQVAQNNEIVPIDNRITEHEVALLPPFSGG